MAVLVLGRKRVQTVFMRMLSSIGDEQIQEPNRVGIAKAPTSCIESREVVA